MVAQQLSRIEPDRAQAPWLLTPSRVGFLGASNDASMVWVEATGSDTVELECIAAAEADRRAAIGQFPTGVMLGRALYRHELSQVAPAPWIRRADRVVVCDAPDSTWLEELGPGRPQVRFLPAPFGPRSFGYLLSWLSGRSRKTQPPPTESQAWDEAGS